MIILLLTINKMASSVKLAIVSKSDEKASFLQNQLVFLYFLYTLVEKQPYLVSTSSYQVSVKRILLLMCIQFQWCLQK